MNDEQSYRWKVCYVILHYNTIDKTIQCISSVLKQKIQSIKTDVKIIIVDNGSLNNSGKILQKKYKTNLVAFKRKLKTIDQKTSKLIDLYTDGQLTKKTFQQKLNALTEQKQTLLQKISETEAKQKAPSAEENSTTLDSLVKHLIKNITIIDNTLDITWNN